MTWALSILLAIVGTTLILLAIAFVGAVVAKVNEKLGIRGPGK